MAKSHTRLAKFVHWSFIVLYVYGIIKQVDDISDLEDSKLLIFEVIFASLFLVIVIGRYFYMRKVETMHASTVPVHRVHKFIAKTVHTSMYVVLIMLPLSGLAIAFLFNQGIKDGPMQLIALSVHEFAATASYVLIAIHVSAAIYSRIKGEGVWSSMVPIFTDEKASKNPVVCKVADFEEQVYDHIERIFSKKND
ncbi:MAG: cytochrome B [Euryarchaeota archaeon]|nr:cytochrome B [Euryarchaeota archaeon]